MTLLEHCFGLTVEKAMIAAGGAPVDHFTRLLRTLAICTAIATPPAFAQNCIVYGSYASSPGVAYTCAFGVVDFNYTSWTFTNLGGGNIRVSGSPAGSTPVMNGTINCADSSFQVSATVSASCTESYSLSGDFDTDTSWTGTFTATFTGSCFDCVNQTVPVSGSTGHVTATGRTPEPFAFSLDQNFPNPFNPATRITFSLARTGNVTLEIYNLLGQPVETLLHRRLPAGVHSVAWEPRELPGGVYFSCLKAGGVVQTRKMMLLR